jgi:hypothetical protein
MVNVFQGQIQFIFMMFPASAKLRASISKHPKQWNLLFFKERQYPIIKHVGWYPGVFAVIDLGKGHLGIGINKGLLIDPAHTFYRTNIIRVLST